tara:strand:- start:299 stop:421 length:123 start_codon:yes stop_codon:yes gene_type:complete
MTSKQRSVGDVSSRHDNLPIPQNSYHQPDQSRDEQAKAGV